MLRNVRENRFELLQRGLDAVEVHFPIPIPLDAVTPELEDAVALLQAVKMASESFQRRGVRSCSGEACAVGASR